MFFLKYMSFFTRMAIPGTSTCMHYLRMIDGLRRCTNNHAVVLDQDSCIRVL